MELPNGTQTNTLWRRARHYPSTVGCECGEEYIADIDAAAKAMRYVYDHYEECLEAAPQRKEWASACQYKNLKPLYLSLVRPSKIILGDRDEITEEYLMTSSVELYKKYTSLYNSTEHAKLLN